MILLTLFLLVLVAFFLVMVLETSIVLSLSIKIVLSSFLVLFVLLLLINVVLAENVISLDESIDANVRIFFFPNDEVMFTFRDLCCSVYNGYINILEQKLHLNDIAEFYKAKMKLIQMK